MENQKPKVKGATGMALPILQGPLQHKDPVCGMSVAPEKAARKVEHAGETYYFCSKGCAERFEQDPANFLAAPGKAGMERGDVPAAFQHEPHSMNQEAPASGATTTTSARGVRYTCPMHPEIVQIGPGSCPICGMALEPMDVFAEVE